MTFRRHFNFCIHEINILDPCKKEKILIELAPSGKSCMFAYFVIKIINVAFKCLYILLEFNLHNWDIIITLHDCTKQKNAQNFLYCKCSLATCIRLLRMTPLFDCKWTKDSYTIKVLYTLYSSKAACIFWNFTYVL